MPTELRPTPRCLFCGEPESIEVMEIWSDHHFQLETCCEALHEALCDELHDLDGPMDRQHWLTRLLSPYCSRGLRRVAPASGSLLIDYHLALTPVSFQQACAFITEHHHHTKAPVGWKCGMGIRNGSTLLGVAVLGRPVSRHIAARGDTLEITRVCVDRTRPDPLRWNACSMLYGWAAREAKARGCQRVISYTRIDEDGTSLKAAGFHPEAKSAGGTWHRTQRPRDLSCAIPKIRWCRSLRPDPTALFAGL